MKPRSEISRIAYRLQVARNWTNSAKCSISARMACKTELTQNHTKSLNNDYQFLRNHFSIRFKSYHSPFLCVGIGALNMWAAVTSRDQLRRSTILSALGPPLYPHSFVSGSSRATSQRVTHPGIALAPNSLNFGVPTTPKPVSSQKASC
ncbi:hypothetical protein L3X38_025406 [Prunus dulcis]|uniref:Uncharacterized protein n=1 Tax=Prunus dulcis TaxID=3755 RepID=A0AAD4Z7Z0_PRUDU|nr:hypothetical protein L3X38_025406 [Prunus dulcis]